LLHPFYSGWSKCKFLAGSDLTGGYNFLFLLYPDLSGYPDFAGFTAPCCAGR
jgi:hypothetical protein